MELPKRKPIRVPGYDYAACGAYFVTICTSERQKTLSLIRRGGPCGRPFPTLTELGQIAETTLLDLEKRYPVQVDCYVIMPDHIHAIFLLTENRAAARAAPTLDRIVGAYKSMVIHAWRSRCNENGQIMGKIWQRGFYDHIVRSEQDLAEIRLYIENNPACWLEKHPAAHG